MDTIGMTANMFFSRVNRYAFASGVALVLFALLLHVSNTVICYVQWKRIAPLVVAGKSFPNGITVAWSDWLPPIGGVVPFKEAPGDKGALGSRL